MDNIIRGCGCTSEEACNLCGFEACQLAWSNIRDLQKILQESLPHLEYCEKLNMSLGGIPAKDTVRKIKEVLKSVSNAS